jgi:hypothetical protein
MSHVGGARSDDRWSGAAPFAFGAALVVLALYLVHPITAGYTLPIGPDGPVYTWLARAAEAAGLPDGPGAGPGVAGLTVLVGTLIGTDPLGTVTILGPVLAACCGLAAGSLLETTLRPSAAGALAAAVLTGAFTAYLAGGWLANVAQVAVFLTAAAALSLAGRSWRAVAAATGLLMAAGLTHRTFALVGLVILIPVVAAEIPAAVRDRRAGRPWRDTEAVRMTMALGGGTALSAGVLVWLSLEPRIPGDTSQDGFFRRLGFRDLLIDRYRERLRGDLTRLAVPLVAGLGLAGLGAMSADRKGSRFLPRLWLSWAAITLAGIVVLAATSWGPPNRMLQFAFFIPLGGAVGAVELARRGGLGAVVAGIAVAAFVGFSMFGWFRQSPAFTERELDAVARAGSSIAALDLDPGAPLVFVVDTDQPAAAYHVTRAGNLIRMGIPADRIGDVRIAVGSPPDVLAGRVTRTGDREHDRIAAVYLREVEPVLARASIFLIRPLNEAGWDPTLGREIAPEVLLLSEPSTAGGSATVGPAGPAPVLDDTGELIWRSILVLAVLAVIGGGWARWGLPERGRRAAAAAAPSVGIAVAVATTVLADRLGVRPGDLSSTALVLAVGAAGYVAAWRAETRTSTTETRLERRRLEEERR